MKWIFLAIISYFAIAALQSLILGSRMLSSISATGITIRFAKAPSAANFQVTDTQSQSPTLFNETVIGNFCCTRTHIAQTDSRKAELFPASRRACYLCRMFSGARCRSRGRTCTFHSIGTEVGRKQVLLSQA